jgi:hypothetical protein
MVELKPGVLQVSDIAKAIGWSVQTTRRWLVSLGAVQKRGRKYVTTIDRLRAVFPEAAEEASKLTQDEDS